jgi:acyl phosphate:glycerol-3-phosphate acyltransferase
MLELAALIIGYLCGSIPFGLVLAKAAGLGDVRKIGSGNIGATNVLRTGNKKIAALTLLCDGMKGAIPVLLLGYFGNEQVAIIAGLAALAGHIFPVWLKFRGGKGVATSIGVLTALYWQLGLLFIAVWLIVAFLFRISSLSALIASALSPVFAFMLGGRELAIPAVLIGATIWIMHRPNIIRLLKGQEPKIDLGTKT